MKKKRFLNAIIILALVLLCSCNSKKTAENNISPTETSTIQELEYVEEDSSLAQYEIKKDDTIEISYLLSIVNHTNETKYFYLYADMEKEDDNLVKEDVIPACEKKTDQKQIYKLRPKQGEDDYLRAVFKGTHGTQELKEDKRTLATSNLIIEEIDEKDIPEDADIFTVDDTWED